MRLRTNATGFSALLVLLAALAVQGCSLGAKTLSLFGGELKVDFVIASNANQNSPLAVELIAIYDKRVFDALKELTARRWFAERVQFLRDHPDASQLETQRWEWVPGQQVETRKVRFRPRARGMVLFVDYFSAGAHRAILDPHQDVLVRLEERGYAVERR